MDNDKNNKMEFGDEKFKEFMNKTSNLKEDEDSLETILNSIKYKMDIISKLYLTTADTYLGVKEKDPIKKDLHKFLNQLIEYATQGLDQFNYVLIDFEETGNEDTEISNEDTDTTDKIDPNGEDGK